MRRGSVRGAWLSYGAAWLSDGAAWLSYGAAWLSYGAGWLSMVRGGSIMVLRGSVWCGVAQLVGRLLAVRHARVRFSAQHHREVFPIELTSDDEMERGLSEWRRINVLNECDSMKHVQYVINKKDKQKEWQPATKPLNLYTLLKNYKIVICTLGTCDFDKIS